MFLLRKNVAVVLFTDNFNNQRIMEIIMNIKNLNKILILSSALVLPIMSADADPVVDPTRPAGGVAYVMSDGGRERI